MQGGGTARAGDYSANHANWCSLQMKRHLMVYGSGRIGVWLDAGQDLGANFVHMSASTFRRFSFLPALR